MFINHNLFVNKLPAHVILEQGPCKGDIKFKMNDKKQGSITKFIMMQSHKSTDIETGFEVWKCSICNERGYLIYIYILKQHFTTRMVPWTIIVVHKICAKLHRDLSTL